MSSLYVFANNVKTALAGAIGSTATTIALASTANFPTIPGGYVWAVTLNDQATQALFEIVYVTAISGSNLTVLRGQEGTSARAWNVGDIVFAADTAGILSSFVTQTQLANVVQLNPGSQQSGFINISGSINSGGTGSFSGDIFAHAVNAAGGSFADDITASDLNLSRPYTNTAIPILPLRFAGPGGTTIGVGPSAGLSSRGITASMLAIGCAGTGAFVAMDVNGNIATPGDISGNSGIFSTSLSAPYITQGGIPVVTSLSSSTLALTRSGANYEIELLSTQLSVGASLVSDGNGGNPLLSLPNYGQWFIEVFYGVQMVTNTNMNLVLSLIGGTITSGFISNANNHTAFNADMWIMLYGKGRTTVNNQTVRFALAVSGGSFDPSNQPWTVRATRTA